MTDTEIKKGLAGVVVDDTAVSKVNPATNSLLYRGYPVQELAARCSFEEVAYLLWNGELPDPEELAAFTEQERRGRALDPAVKQWWTPCRSPHTRWMSAAPQPRSWAHGTRSPRIPRAKPTWQRQSTCSRPCQPSSPTTSAAGAARTGGAPRRPGLLRELPVDDLR